MPWFFLFSVPSLSSLLSCGTAQVSGSARLFVSLEHSALGLTPRLRTDGRCSLSTDDGEDGVERLRCSVLFVRLDLWNNCRDVSVAELHYCSEEDFAEFDLALGLVALLTVTDTDTPVCLGQASGSEHIASRSTCC